jgi:hypothetical protein
MKAAAIIDPSALLSQHTELAQENQTLRRDLETSTATVQTLQQDLHHATTDAASILKEHVEIQQSLGAERLAHEQLKQQLTSDAASIMQERVEMQQLLDAERLAKAQLKQQLTSDAASTMQERAEMQQLLDAERLAHEQLKQQLTSDAASIVQERVEMQQLLDAERLAHEQLKQQYADESDRTKIATETAIFAEAEIASMRPDMAQSKTAMVAQQLVSKRLRANLWEAESLAAEHLASLNMQIERVATLEESIGQKKQAISVNSEVRALKRDLVASTKHYDRSRCMVSKLTAQLALAKTENEEQAEAIRKQNIESKRHKARQAALLREVAASTNKNHETQSPVKTQSPIKTNETLKIVASELQLEIAQLKAAMAAQQLVTTLAWPVSTWQDTSAVANHTQQIDGEHDANDPTDQQQEADAYVRALMRWDLSQISTDDDAYKLLVAGIANAVAHYGGILTAKLCAASAGNTLFNFLTDHHSDTDAELYNTVAAEIARGAAVATATILKAAGGGVGEDAAQEAVAREHVTSAVLAGVESAAVRTNSEEDMAQHRQFYLRSLASCSADMFYSDTGASTVPELDSPAREPALRPDVGRRSPPLYAETHAETHAEKNAETHAATVASAHLAEVEEARLAADAEVAELKLEIELASLQRSEDELVSLQRSAAHKPRASSRPRVQERASSKPRSNRAADLRQEQQKRAPTFESTADRFAPKRPESRARSPGDRLARLSELHGSRLSWRAAQAEAAEAKRAEAEHEVCTFTPNIAQREHCPGRTMFALGKSFLARQAQEAPVSDPNHSPPSPSDVVPTRDQLHDDDDDDGNEADKGGSSPSSRSLFHRRSPVAPSRLLEVTFSDAQEALGLTFALTADGQTELTHVAADSAAANVAGVVPGLTLDAVAGPGLPTAGGWVPLEHTAFAETLVLIQAAGRPLSLRFVTPVGVAQQGSPIVSVAPEPRWRERSQERSPTSHSTPIHAVNTSTNMVEWTPHPPPVVHPTDDSNRPPRPPPPSVQKPRASSRSRVQERASSPTNAAKTDALGYHDHRITEKPVDNRSKSSSHNQDSSARDTQAARPHSLRAPSPHTSNHVQQLQVTSTVCPGFERRLLTNFFSVAEFQEWEYRRQAKLEAARLKKSEAEAVECVFAPVIHPCPPDEYLDALSPGPAAAEDEMHLAPAQPEEAESAEEMAEAERRRAEEKVDGERRHAEEKAEGERRHAEEKAEGERRRAEAQQRTEASRRKYIESRREQVQGKQKPRASSRPRVTERSSSTSYERATSYEHELRARSNRAADPEAARTPARKAATPSRKVGSSRKRPPPPPPKAGKGGAKGPDEATASLASIVTSAESAVVSARAARPSSPAGRPSASSSASFSLPAAHRRAAAVPLPAASWRPLSPVQQPERRGVPAPVMRVLSMNSQQASGTPAASGAGRRGARQPMAPHSSAPAVKKLKVKCTGLTQNSQVDPAV